jgi:type IV pilus assembly protein PilY1
MTIKKRFTSGLSGIVGSALLTLLAAPVVLADDTEIFVQQPSTVTAPNIMLIMDTSGSMGTLVNTTTSYVPTTSYAGTGTCSGIATSGWVYYSTGNNPPACNSNQYMTSTQQKCADANGALGATGAGSYGPANLIRWVSNGGGATPWRWRRNSFNNAQVGDVECEADSVTSPYPRAQSFLTNAEKGSSTSAYTATASQSYWAPANSPSLQQYRLFSANYVVYYNQFRTVSLGTRMSIMQDAATQLLGSLTGVNVGLMRYSNNSGSGDFRASGGYVVEAVSPIATSRANLIATVNGFSANGYTPLSETLFEAERYFSGGAVLFGNSSVPGTSVAASRLPATPTGANYDSPAEFSCQKNYVVYLTDGLPTADSEANVAINALPNFGALGGSCLAAGSGPDSSWPDSGLCLGALAQYMFNADLRSGSGNPAGKQNVRSYFIGLGSDFVDSSNQLNAAYSYLDNAATRGGGSAYQAGDLTELNDTLNKIFADIHRRTQSFAAPAVGVNEIQTRWRRTG